MSFTPQCSQLQERADKAFLQTTSTLILSTIPAARIGYWQIDTGTNITVLPGFSTNPLPCHLLETDQDFIQSHQHHLQQGKFLLADRQSGWCEFNPESHSRDAHYDRIFLGACYQDLYIGGIYLQSIHGCWRRSHHPFFQAIAQHYACHYYWQKQLVQEPSSMEKKLREQSLNLSHIHHEFRTPLTGILGFSKMLRDELYGGLNAKQHQYVQGILNSAEHLLALVNDFLDLSKINANCEELFWELVAVEDLCLAVISMVQPKAKDRGLALTLEIGTGVDLCRL
ncbi:MAG: HAMP domain-containing sensor histidine kinase, partial [Synechocystis sp.]|nr:HAMP domain-containing sensor histidine kinase [Synechocystis sp.]